jgi:S1-C subfamily serine protease/uncharacterized protein
MWIVALIVWVTLSGGSAAAFECVGVRLPSTIVICSDPELMRLADERQEAINEARGRIGEEAWPQLWEDQKDWVRSYATACGVPQDRPAPIPVPPAIKACFKSAAQARIAYIRAYGLATAGSPAIVPRAGSVERIGPSFDCSKANNPLTFLICDDAELTRLDFRFNQAYWALFQQIGPTAQPQLKEEDIEFIDQVQEKCGLPKSGVLTAELLRSRDCVKDAYDRKRAGWLARLTSEAREEALRPPEEHLVLQQALQQLGFLSPGPVDGVYARGTRAAIVAWQSARGRAVTGLLGDIDARAIAREISAGSQVIAQALQTGFSGGSAAPEARAAQPRVASREEPKPSVPEPNAEIAGTGTAFAISKTGDFLTNYHVVKGCASVRLRNAGLRRDGVVIANDERNDLAVLRAQISGVPLLHFREGKPIRPADPVVVLGFPYAGLLATAPQVTTGAVSALAGVRDDTRYLQLTAPVQPGNSGGPLLDLSGNVVGIVSARINELAVAEATGTLPQNINFAIKSGIVRGFLEANHIDYETAQSTSKLDPADVGESAAKSVIMLECVK